MASIKSSKKDQADDNGLPEMRLNEMIGKEAYPSVHGLKETVETAAPTRADGSLPDSSDLPEMHLNDMIGKEPYPSVHGLKERPEVDGLLSQGSGAPQTVFSTDADTIPEMRINEMVGHDNYPSIHGVKEKLGK